MSDSDDDDIFKELEDEINNMEITDEDRHKLQERSSNLSEPIKTIDINFNDIIKKQDDKANKAVNDYITSGCEINTVLRSNCSGHLYEISKNLLKELKPINKI